MSDSVKDLITYIWSLTNLFLMLSGLILQGYALFLFCEFLFYTIKGRPITLICVLPVVLFFASSKLRKICLQIEDRLRGERKKIVDRLEKK